MAGASLGGYIGDDFGSFFSAVNSGAAGTYMGVLMADAGINTELMIQPGQMVSVRGNSGLAVAPSWGSGTFTVRGMGVLSLSALVIHNYVLNLGGTVNLRECTIGPLATLQLEGPVFTSTQSVFL